MSDAFAGIEPLIFEQVIKLPYRYTAGDAQKAFLRGLADATIVGGRSPATGKVIVPAPPYCPDTAQPIEEFVPVADVGAVEGCTTVARAGGDVTYAMIRLDGADTPMLHVIDTNGGSVEIGDRVRARWADDRSGEITDIEAFVPED